MRIQIILSGSGGELDRQDLDLVREESVNSENIIEAIKAWSLAPGDTIKIVEVS